MNLTLISDTHSLHDRLPAIGAGDVLIHCGDFTGRGTLDDTLNFTEFMAAQPFTHKIVIAGNHDWCFEDKRRNIAEHILKEYGLIYLNDSGIEIDGVKFWGSPIQPEFCDWAFNRQRGEAIRQHWDKIPADTHEGYGKKKVGKTLFINACVLDERYQVRNPPIVVKL